MTEKYHAIIVRGGIAGILGHYAAGYATPDLNVAV